MNAVELAYNKALRKENKKRMGAMKSLFSKIGRAKWFKVNCIECGYSMEATPQWVQDVWQTKGCPKCMSKMGYALMEMSTHPRQRVYYRQPETNELIKAPKSDLAYKLTKNQREKGNNLSYKADLKNESFLRKPTKNRVNKHLGMKPKERENGRKQRRKTIREAREESREKSRRW